MDLDFALMDSDLLRSREHERFPLHARVTLQSELGTMQGWSLNVSRGGARVACLTERADAAQQMLASRNLVLRIEGHTPRRVRVAWSRDSEGGCVAGLAFVDSSVRTARAA